jgi:hypothetical protein
MRTATWEEFHDYLVNCKVIMVCMSVRFLKSEFNSYFMCEFRSFTLLDEIKKKYNLFFKKVNTITKNWIESKFYSCIQKPSGQAYQLNTKKGLIVRILKTRKGQINCFSSMWKNFKK